jgi:AraC-like DNA-binding protein
LTAKYGYAENKDMVYKLKMKSKKTEISFIEEGFLPDIQYLVFRKCTPSWHQGIHFIENFEITYVTKGGARYTLDNVEYEVSAGDLICIPQGSLKKAITYSNNLMSCFSVNFLIRNNDAGREWPFPHVSHIGSKRDLLRYFHELMYTWFERPPGFNLKAQGLLMLIIHRIVELTLYHDTNAGDYRIQKATRYLTKHYQEKIQVKKLAGMTGLNPVYFGALFKQETGLTIHQYLIKTRVQNAVYLLRGGLYKVTEAAEYCGFSDVHHFYRQFKAVMGFPPSQCIPKRTS